MKMKFKQIAFPILSLISASLIVKGDEISEETKNKEYCCPEGQIADCQCKYESVEEMNKELTPVLQELVTTTYFRYYKVDLWKKCPFWPDGDLLCTSERCSVPSVEDEKIPEEWKSENLGKVDKSSIFGASSMFNNCDYSSNEFCVFDENSEGLRYVDLPTNPERFTGYTGDSATRVWKSIYNENCFGIPNHLDKETCIEKRIYYKLISGLHASISTNVCYYWLDTKTGVWGPNVDCFKWKIGKFPDRIENIYTNYAIYIRAINKISNYLNNYSYCNGNDEEDLKVTHLVKKVTDISKEYPFTFDETQFFNSPETKELLNDTKFQFRNVSRIMDCVACEKCRLWGKLQITGLGTALKILFSTKNVNSISLKRSEIVAFINGFNKLSTTINMIDEFRELWRAKEEGSAQEENSTKEKRDTKESNTKEEGNTEKEKGSTGKEKGNTKEEKPRELSKADIFLIKLSKRMDHYFDKLKTFIFNIFIFLKLVDPNNLELKDKIGTVVISIFSIGFAMILQLIFITKALNSPVKIVENPDYIKEKDASNNKKDSDNSNKPGSPKSPKNGRKKSKKIN